MQLTDCMTLDAVFQAGATVTTLASIWLMGDRSLWGPRIGVVAQAFWFGTIWMNSLWGVFPVTAVMLAIHLRNLRKWSAGGRREVAAGESADEGSPTTPTLHVHPQATWHGSAEIVGNAAALETLHRAIAAALSCGNAKAEVHAADGEGYSLSVRLLPDRTSAWEGESSPYVLPRIWEAEALADAKSAETVKALLQRCGTLEKRLGSALRELAESRRGS